MHISIQPLTPAEFDATDEVIKAAYNIAHSRKESLHRYLALQPDGSFVVKDEGTIIGFGGAIDYGSFAYIGLMSVHPTMQKQGIGGLLLEHLMAWLDAHGCPSILLDASSAGAPLYKHYNFTEDDQTVVLQLTQHVPMSRQNPLGISLLSKEDITDVAVFDAPHFGAKRGGLLASYWVDDPQCAFIVRDGNGQLTGYLFAQPRTLGPWVASTVEDAERLLLHALTLPFESEPSVFVSTHHSDALRLLNRYGFSQQRTLSHMRKGKHVQRSRHTTLYGQASLGFG
jgi:GNAT superfamily N-acetyltransferase